MNKIPDIATLSTKEILAIHVRERGPVPDRKDADAWKAWMRPYWHDLSARLRVAAPANKVQLNGHPFTAKDAKAVAALTLAVWPADLAAALAAHGYKHEGTTNTWTAPVKLTAEERAAAQLAAKRAKLQAELDKVQADLAKNNAAIVPAQDEPKSETVPAKTRKAAKKAAKKAA